VVKKEKILKLNEAKKLGALQNTASGEELSLPAVPDIKFGKHQKLKCKFYIFQF